MRLFKFACKEGESLVYFDHVLDVVRRSYHLEVDFAHAYALSALRWTRVHGQNRPLYLQLVQDDTNAARLLRYIEASTCMQELEGDLVQCKAAVAKS